MNLSKLDGLHGEHRTPTVFTINEEEYILVWSGIRNELRFYNPHNGSIVKTHQLKIRRAGQNIISPIISGDTLILANKLGIHALSLKNIFNNEPSNIWSTNLKAKGPETSSPVKVRNRIFIVSDNGKATCVDSENGEICWQENLKPYGKDWKSSWMIHCCLNPEHNIFIPVMVLTC
jgi:outer membrane protein assembly factor BamB